MHDPLPDRRHRGRARGLVPPTTARTGPDRGGFAAPAAAGTIRTPDLPRARPTAGDAA